MLAAIAVLGAGLFALNRSAYNEKQDGGEIAAYRATLTGEYVCLPHTDTGPQTDECAFGIKTDAGDYYALDFNLSSQAQQELTTGDRFSASGVITPIELLSTDHWRQYPVIGIFSVTDSVQKLEPVSYPCNADAKICPDGSSVGRTGPKCEFAACPPADAKEGTVTTFLGGSATTLNVTLNPRVVISDSRCPQGVQCIWAGTVEVKTAMSTQVAHGEQTLKLGEPVVFGDFTVTFTAVTPTKTQDKISDSSYRFTFTVKKR